MRSLFLILRFILVFLVLTNWVYAEEIHSNRLGGGFWSDSSTWVGKIVPTSNDEVIISARDMVVFDRNDVDKPSCKKLLLDPNAVLTFQNGFGRRTFSVDGAIESYGSIKMDASSSLKDVMEIRLISEIPEEQLPHFESFHH